MRIGGKRGNLPGDLLFSPLGVYTPVTQTAAFSGVRSPSGVDQVPH